MKAVLRLASFVSIGCAAVCPVSASPIVSFWSDEPVIEVGETATVTVKFYSGDKRIYSWGGDLVYNDEFVSVSNVSLSPEWRPGVSHDGDILAAYSQPGQDQLSNMFTFQVTGLEEGISCFSLARTEGDDSENWVAKKGDLVEPLCLPGFIQVIAVPEPLAISGTGVFAAIACLRRKRTGTLV